MPVVEKANRNGGSDAGKRSFPRLLLGDDLRGLLGRRQSGQRRSGNAVVLDDQVLPVLARKPKAGFSRQPQRESVMKGIRRKAGRLRLDLASYENLSARGTTP